jgi:DNA-binding transcriptional LysR family regulator
MRSFKPISGSNCAPRLKTFLDLYPDVGVQLTLVDRLVNLVDDGANIAIRVTRELAPGLASRKLCGVRFLLVATPAYLEESGVPATSQALLEHRCCYPNDSQYGERWTLKRGGETVEIDVPARITANNSIATLAFIEAGGGVGLVPDFAATASLEQGAVRQVLPEWEFCTPYAASVHAVYTPGRHLAKKSGCSSITCCWIGPSSSPPDIAGNCWQSVSVAAGRTGPGTCCRSRWDAWLHS